MLTKNRTLFYLVLILLLAALVRLVGSTHFTLWTDEGWTTWFVQDQNPLLTMGRLLRSRHPPLFFITLATWQNFAGTSHLAMRFPEIMMGIFATAVVYRLAADVFNLRVGLYAALLFSVLDIAVYYTQEVRHYGWLMSIGALTSMLFLRFIKEPSNRHWLMYSISVTLLMLTHYFGIFIMGIQFLFGMFLWRADRPQKRRLVWGWVFSVVMYAPWLPVVYFSFGNVERGVGGFPGSYGSSLQDLMSLLTLLFGGQLALLGAMYAIGLANMRRWSIDRLYLLVTGMGLFAVMFAMNEWRGVLTPRMVSFLTPPLMVVCAYGITQLQRRYQPIVLAISVVISLITMPNIQPRANLADPVAYLASQYEPGDLIVQELGKTDFATTYEIEQAIDDPNWIGTVWVEEPAEMVQEFTPDLEATQRVWVIHWVHAPIILPRLQEGYLGYQLVEHTSYANTPDVPIPDEEVDVYLFERPIADDPLTFGESLILDDAIFSGQQQADDSLFLELWWQASESLGKDYSVAVHLRDAEGNIVAQLDEAIADLPSSQWKIGEAVHSRHALAIPADAPVGDYDLTLAVYWYQEPNAPLETVNGPVVTLGPVTISE
ncbi:MAG: hypothetical protein CL607_01560 [Anaerolineaceae bacterium]|nr:hypothetical protein [Anaerolineaceae bacterium]